MCKKNSENRNKVERKNEIDKGELRTGSSEKGRIIIKQIERIKLEEM